jgi:3-oxoacyl-[acyl-carrier protein] reductase
MDLGIKGRTAIVNAASKGLGKASAMALGREGVNLVISARTAETLEAAAEEIRQETGANVTTVVADVATVEGRSAILAACPEPDILVNNCGGPPPGNFRDWTRDDWISALDSNMLATIEMIKATIDGMIEREFGRVVNVTSSSVKAPISILGLSNGARAGLTGFMAGLAREVVQHNVIINNLLPGMFATDRLLAPMRATAEANDQPLDEVSKNFTAQIPAGRFGDPDEFGAMCAFLCSQYVGYMAGQNVLMDGGQINVTM